MKILVLIFTIFAVACTGCYNKSFQDVPEINEGVDRYLMQQLTHSAIQIKYACGMDAPRSIASGVVVDRGPGYVLIATAQHVSEEDSEDCYLVAEDWKGLSDYAEVVAEDELEAFSALKVEWEGLYDKKFLLRLARCTFILCK